MEKNTNMDSQQKHEGANCNAKISTGFYVFLAVAAIIAAISWFILS